MSEQVESYFVPYEESGYPEKEQRMKDLAQEKRISLPENYTLKKCEVHIGPEQTCAQPATWVRMTPDRKLGYIIELAVCDEHKTDNAWTATTIPVKGERDITYKEGDVLYFLTIQDDIVGEFTVRVWLNQSGGDILPMIIDKNPSPWLKQIRERAEKMRHKW